jgi:Asp-tRNA(Asn)/Glu-tRNA(Gln) amidotransferase A subunit family amidase
LCATVEAGQETAVMSADFDAATIGALAPVELANHYLQRIKHLNPLLNAYIE